MAVYQFAYSLRAVIGVGRGSRVHREEACDARNYFIFGVDSNLRLFLRDDQDLRWRRRVIVSPFVI